MDTFAEGFIPGSFRLPGGPLQFVGVGTKPHHTRAIRGALRSWQKLVRGYPSPVTHDAAELARLAYSKWAYYRRGLEIGATLEDVMAQDPAQPQCGSRCAAAR